MSGWRLSLLAAFADLCSVAAFVRLPWAAGRQALAGRQFDGPRLARLVHNAGLLLGRAGPLADVLALALWTVPVAAMIAAVFALGASFTEQPVTVLRWAAGFSLVGPIVCCGVLLLLAAGPEAGQFLARRPGAGPLLCAAAGMVATIALAGAVATGSRAA